MIRVLHFAGSINDNDFIDSVLRRLDRSRFSPWALLGSPPRRVGHYEGDEAYPTRTLHLGFSWRVYPVMLRRLMGEIRRIRPHILHSHHYDEAVVAAMAARLARVPCFVIGHHYSDHIYVLTRGLKRRAYLGIEALCNRAAARIVVPSAEVLDILSNRQNVPRHKISVIPFGFDLDRFKPSGPDRPARLRAELGLDGRYVVLSCCRLSREKGLYDLLDAVAAVRREDPRVAYVMLGRGPEEAGLRRRAAELGIQELVHFAGWQDQPMDWLAMADVVVQPSLSESFCQVLVEALALERPVIMTPVGAAPEVIGDNERGRLVPKGDSRALASAFRELMRDPRLARALARGGREYLVRKLDPAALAKQHGDLYETVLRESENPGAARGVAHTPSGHAGGGR